MLGLLHRHTVQQLLAAQLSPGEIARQLEIARRRVQRIALDAAGGGGGRRRGRHVAEETVILDVMVLGTHAGTWRGIPPTGRRVEFPVCAIFTFDDEDRIQAEIAHYDRMTASNQLGVM